MEPKGTYCKSSNIGHPQNLVGPNLSWVLILCRVKYTRQFLNFMSYFKNLYQGLPSEVKKFLPHLFSFENTLNDILTKMLNLKKIVALSFENLRYILCTTTAKKSTIKHHLEATNIK